MKRQHALIIFVRIFLFGLCGWTTVSHAVVGTWQSEGPVKVRLISPVAALEGLQTLPLGLHIQLEEGWKTYWRTPGAAGAPPRLKLNTPRLTSPQWHWPAPGRYEQFGQQLYGYTEEVLIPIDYQLAGNEELLDISGDASVFVCREVCIPVKVKVGLQVPPIAMDEAEEDWQAIRLYSQFQSRVPSKRPATGVVARWSEAGLYASVPMAVMGDTPDLFPEGIDIEEWPAPIVLSKDGAVQAWWLFDRPEPLDDVPDRIALTYRDSVQAFTVTPALVQSTLPVIPEGYGESDHAPESTAAEWWGMILLALIGGVILNLMPCVLPVISIKLVAWSHLKHAARGVIRLHALMTTLGILSLFWILAGGLMVLRTMGYYVGWGIQFQSPYFLLFLVILLSVFAANFMGWFEFRLPEKWQDSLNEVGNHSSAMLKSYLHGMTATLLATPCSAPFLGTAVAFALTQEALGIWVIFTALGIGLALPYLLIMVWPGTVSRVPKGGRWSLVLRHVLAGALLLTVIWLLWVLAASVSVIGLALIALLVMISLTLLRRIRLANLLGVAGLWVAAVVTVQASSEWTYHGESQDISHSEWQTFTRANWNALRESKQTVLLDITADWCITCQYNKKVVLETREMLQYFRESGVILMQADWTHPNEDIEQLLTEYGRAGIPFNLLVGPKKPDGILFPEILTESVVREAVTQVK